MRFEVPQFIDVEDKIFGPLTFKQFIYIVGGAGLTYVAYRVIPFPFWIPIAPLFIIFGLLLAFYKINNRPFIEVVQSYLTFKLNGKVYLWKYPDQSNRSTPTQEKNVVVTTESESTLNAEKIKTLARNLDVLDSAS